MRRSRTESRLSSFCRPDVTPLVDLTFLLLIVFMITAPVLEYSIDISPPDLNAAAIQSSEHKIINLDAEGTIYLDDIPVTEKELVKKLTGYLNIGSQVEVFIRADRSQPYGNVVELMKLIKGIGITDVSLVTQAEER